MGFLDFLFKKEDKSERTNAIINSQFGAVVKMVYCQQIRAWDKICKAFNCPAHFAYVPSDFPDKTGNYPVYTMRLLMGELHAGNHFELLEFIFSQDDEEKKFQMFQERLGMTEEEVRSLFLCDMQYEFNTRGDILEFHSDSVMDYLKDSDLYYHLRAIGQIIHTEIPDAYVSSDFQKVFVMLNGGERGEYKVT